MAIEVPESKHGDAAHALAKAGLSLIPVVGWPAVELFQHLVQPPLERRRIEWMHQVGVKLQELEAQGFNLDDLQHNELLHFEGRQASPICVLEAQHETPASLR